MDTMANKAARKPSRKPSRGTPRKKVTKKSTKKVGRKKASASAAAASDRSRRTPEQMIADLKQRIKDVEQKAAAKELKKSDSVRRTLSIVRGIAKALDEAKAEGNTALRHALADAHKPLSAYLENRGVRVPKPRLPRGRKPRS
ncbi:MAG: hypothetical protein GY711_06555 [bacterium]|nr:hypothetical protein [bacterium]